MTPEEMRDRLSELGIESEFVSYPNKKAIGVKWQINGIVWKYDWYGSTPQALSVFMHYSPEQAIAATVGVGTCHMRLVYEEEDADGCIWPDHYECDACGAKVNGIMPSCDTEIPPKFCPNCGKRIRGATE